MTTPTSAAADLYLRLSLDHPGATAIERQEADCRRWCAVHGLEVLKVHVDRGVSGYSEREQAHRDGFTAALNAVAQGEATTLVVWKLDRLSRRGVGQRMSRPSLNFGGGPVVIMLRSQAHSDWWL
jgi:site-specific DNA recombinase